MLGVLSVTFGDSSAMSTGRLFASASMLTVLASMLAPRVGLVIAGASAATVTASATPASCSTASTVTVCPSGTDVSRVNGEHARQLDGDCVSARWQAAQHVHAVEVGDRRLQALQRRRRDGDSGARNGRAVRRRDRPGEDRGLPSLPCRWQGGQCDGKTCSSQPRSVSKHRVSLRNRSGATRLSHP